PTARNAECASRDFGSQFAEHCGLSNQLVRRLSNHVGPIKSLAIGLPAISQWSSNRGLRLNQDKNALNFMRKRKPSRQIQEKCQKNERRDYGTPYTGKFPR